MWLYLNFSVCFIILFKLFLVSSKLGYKEVSVLVLFCCVFVLPVYLVHVRVSSGYELSARRCGEPSDNSQSS